MSYILKALRKSEAERARGTVPGLATQHAVAAKGRGPLWPWVVAGALVVNAAVVISGVWRPEIPLWRSGPAEVDSGAVARPAPPAQAMPDPTRAATRPAAALQAVATENTAGSEQTAVPTPVAAPRAAEPSPAAPPITPRDSRQEAARVETRLPAATVASDVAVQPAPAPGSVRPDPSPLTTDASAGPVAPVAAAAPRPASKPAAILALADRTPAPEPPTSLEAGPAPAAGPDLALTVAEPEPPAAEAPPEPDPYASVPMLWQLPSLIRSKLPEISLTVHVYAPESSGRFVIVNRRKYREGDALGVGVKLEAIVPDGVILDYDGRIFKKRN